MVRPTAFAAFALVCLLPLLSSGCDEEDDDGSGSGGEGGEGTGGSEDGSGGSGTAGAEPGTGGSEPTDEEGCGQPSGPGTTVSGSIDGEVTWTPDGSPYIVSGEVYVEGDLLLEACTVVQLGEGAGFQVRGSLVARGTAEYNDDGDLVLFPVAFVPLVEGEAWASIDVSLEGELDLEVTGFVGGGAREATIHAWGEDQYGLSYRNLRAVGVGISGSVNYGVMLENRAGFTEDSADLAIDSSGSEDYPFPIYVEAGAVGALPAQLTLEDNVQDEILVYPFRQVEEDTMRNLGYPYRIRGELKVAHENALVSDDVSTLTIEPGVTLRLEDYAGSGVTIGSGDGNLGRLVAVGTAEEPIRFESAAEVPAAGDWLGLYFGNPVATGNQLEYVEIAHAGGFSGAQGWGCGPIENHASILILNDVEVAPFIENTTIEAAGGDTQILLGWDYDGDPAGAAQAILDANTFDASGPDCRVSLPQNADSQCPGLDAEPDCL
jgi:hypothetical protein